MNMLSPFSTPSSRILHTAALALASSLLVSCEEKETKPAAAQPAPVEETAAVTPDTTASTETENSAAIEAKAQLYDLLLSKNHALMSNYANNPVFTAAVRDALELMQAYYAILAEEDEVTVERFKLAYTIAKSCRDLTAYARAEEAYQAALADYEALAEDVRNSIEMKNTLSSIYNGIASCLLTQAGKAEEAASYYDKQLAQDKELFETSKPDADGNYPEGITEKDYFTAIANLVSSYRCKGDSLVATDELEDARDIYKKGPEIMKGTSRITPEMLFEYVELLTALGNLESRCGNTQQAVGAWGTALKLCAQINQQSKLASEKLRSKNYFERLKPLVEKGTAELKAAEAELESIDDMAPTIMPSEEEAAAEAAEAAEAEAAAEAAAAEEKASSTKSTKKK